MMGAPNSFSIMAIIFSLETGFTVFWSRESAAKSSFDLGTFTLVGETLPIDDVAEGYVPRRKILDKILVDAAVQAGAEMREDFCIRELLTEGDRVVGIRGQSAGGSPVTEKDRCSIVAFPTNDNLACVVVVRSHEQFQTIRTNAAEQYMKTLQLAPSLARRVQDGRQEERFVGTGDLPNFFRKPYGPGWALVGDAGYHKDPILGHGISDAFHDVELLATAIDEGLSGRRPLQKALAHYERQRNEDAQPIYEMSIEFAELKPPSAQMQQLFNALRTNQTELNRYFAAIEGTISPSAFFSPDNIARIIAGANQPMLYQQFTLYK
jgi:flavin-dependent dehydrogenase